jgi:hypothetical protein
MRRSRSVRSIEQTAGSVRGCSAVLGYRRRREGTGGTEAKDSNQSWALTVDSRPIAFDPVPLLS